MSETRSAISAAASSDGEFCLLANESGKPGVGNGYVGHCFLLTQIADTVRLARNGGSAGAEWRRGQFPCRPGRFAGRLPTKGEEIGWPLKFPRRFAITV